MATAHDEQRSLLVRGTDGPALSDVPPRSRSPQRRRAPIIVGILVAATVVCLASLFTNRWRRSSALTALRPPLSSPTTATATEATLWLTDIYETYDDDEPIEAPLLGTTNRKYWVPPSPERRCDWVLHIFRQRAEAFDVPQHVLRDEYRVQSTDYNVFFRATAELFWLDFAGGKWANFSLADLGLFPEMDGVPFTDKSLYTWITGDQHLSNFGAWKNRGGEVVFSVNDFDEAAIYDFHIDVLRVAVSVYNHAYMNGFSPNVIKNIVYALLGTYVGKVFSFVGNDVALVSEITPQTAQGKLQEFLLQVEKANSSYKMLDKYTVVDPTTGERHLLKNEETRLEPLDADLEERVRRPFTAEQYGATMLKMGFKVRNWDDDYYRVIDVARRVGSGVGSYGVDRYYVLLNGNDGKEGGSAIILDVKYEPWGAVSKVLSTSDAAWYDVMFPHAAARAVLAQRALTSFTDPFTGWVMIDGRAFVVRQRSPYKAAPDLDSFTNKEDFTVFAEQVAIATATSHVRGSVSKSPAQFKHMLFAALEEYRHRRAWRKAVTKLAMNYHEQVLLDYECFKDFVEKNFR